jgi:hypothetical protein
MLNESKYFASRKIRKNKKINYRCPKWAANQILDKQFLAKHGLKNFQDLFQYLVVSGVVYLKPEILQLVKNNIDKYRTKYKHSALAKLGKTNVPKFDEFTQIRADFYEQDFINFNNFCVEQNVKPIWVYHCLFIDGFLKEDPAVLKLIKDCQQRNVKKRKNIIARLVKDKYIDVLPDADCKQILNHLTKKYDRKEFDPSLIIDEVVKIEQKTKQQEEEDEFDKELNRKMISVQAARKTMIQMAVEPVDLDKLEAGIETDTNPSNDSDDLPNHEFGLTQDDE